MCIRRSWQCTQEKDGRQEYCSLTAPAIIDFCYALELSKTTNQKYCTTHAGLGATLAKKIQQVFFRANWILMVICLVSFLYGNELNIDNWIIYNKSKKFSWSMFISGQAILSAAIGGMDMVNHQAPES